ncbi:MAG: TonB-dependent receptor [Bacteroidaceae bacterium]|nr:TonB-dependent receptor [Bacteroidaceae bacterium]
MKTQILALVALLGATLSFAKTDSLALSEVVVTGTRSAVDVRHTPYTVTVIDRPTLTAQNHTNVLPTVMQQVPSLLVTSRSIMGYGVSTGAAGGISQRGLSGGAGQLLVLIDGHPQYNGVYGHPISDSYQTLLAERVEVLRGPASLLYGGNAMGGVINIVTRAVPTDGVTGDATVAVGSYGTVQAEAATQVRSGRFTATVAAQYGRTDNHRPNMGFEQYGGYVKLGYDLATHWSLSADLDLTHFNASNPGAVTQLKLENDQWITRGAASIALLNHFDRTSGALTVYDNFGRHKINDGYNADGGTPQTDYFRSRDAVAGVSWYQTARFAESTRLTVGLDYQHIYGRAFYTDRATGAVDTTQRRLMQSAHAHENEVAGYAALQQEILSCLTADLGVRYDHHSTAGGEWVPQFGLVWRPIATGELKGIVSKGFRNPNTREMYMYGTANHDSLRAERLWNYEISWRQRLIDGLLTYGINLFLLKCDNLIQTVAGRNVNTGELRNTGIELEARWRFAPNWAIATNHSLLHMRHHVVAAPRYKAFIGADYNGTRWSALCGLQYVHGLYTSVGADETTETFCLLNAAVGYALTRNISLWLRGENLLAQRYEYNLGYPMPRATVMGGVKVKF